jgi:hypothetical protein
LRTSSISISRSLFKPMLRKNSTTGFSFSSTFNVSTYHVPLTHQMLDKLYIYEITEKSLKHFENNMTFIAVITLWELLTNCQTLTFIMNSSDKLSWLPTDFISCQGWAMMITW